ncbi:hypothetical protein [Enterococcus saccharolyticus]|uniref:hypothetical protein n=1 Tax=Enterococcus saccharolyticus TaxID=41997 RepID=UPI001E64E30F|nr:hypothetical protein [Enterococcus saccharolyticus]
MSSNELANKLYLQKSRSNFRKPIENFNFFLEFVPLNEVKQVVHLLSSQHPLYIHGRGIS